MGPYLYCSEVTEQEAQNDNEGSLEGIGEAETVVEDLEKDTSVIRKGNTVRYRRFPESEWINGKIISRAGKSTGKYKTWWNVKNMHTGHIQAEDLNDIDHIENVPDSENLTEEAETFVMNIPRQLHGDRRCVKAKAISYAKYQRV